MCQEGHHQRYAGQCEEGEKLLQRLDPVVRSVVARFARDQATADELGQACRIRILERWEQCRDPEAVFGWAKRLCHRVCVTAAENERRERGRFVQDEHGIASAETSVPDPLAAVETSEMQLRVRSAVGRLPADQRRLLILRYWQGLTTVDIARRLDLPASTVRTRLRRACLLLQRAREIVCYAPRRPSLWSRGRENDGSSPVVVGGEHLTMNHRAGRPTSATLLGGVEMF